MSATWQACQTHDTPRYSDTFHGMVQLSMNTIRSFQFLGLFLSVVGLLLVTSCVSVNIGKGATKRYTELHFESPAQEFAKVEDETSDHVWRHVKNGNTISYYSECESQTDPTLMELLENVTQSLDEKNSLENRNLVFNGRESLYSKINTKVDGVPTQVQNVIFKKHNCIFIISYVGVLSQAPNNQKDFERFLQRFVVR